MGSRVFAFYQEEPMSRGVSVAVKAGSVEEARKVSRRYTRSGEVPGRLSGSDGLCKGLRFILGEWPIW